MLIKNILQNKTQKKIDKIIIDSNITKKRIFTKYLCCLKKIINVFNRI